MSVVKISASFSTGKKQTSLGETAKGVLFFEYELPLISGAIEKEFPISINNLKGTFATPRYPEKFPLDTKVSALISPKSCDPKLKEVFWGSIMSWPKGECNVKSCLIEIDIENSINVTTFLMDVDSWYQRFLDNLTIVSGHNVRGTQKVHTVAPVGHGKFELYSDKKLLSVHAPTSLTVYHRDKDKEYGISYEQLKEAADITSAGKKPLFEFYFFMDAWEAFQHDNYRKTILDAATALEIALNNVLKKKLPVEEHFKNDVLKNYNSLSKKRSLCKTLKINLPKYHYEKEFDEVRNHAIHIGRYPTRVEAQKALEIANDILDKIIPDKFEVNLQ